MNWNSIAPRSGADRETCVTRDTDPPRRTAGPLPARTLRTRRRNRGREGFLPPHASHGPLDPGREPPAARDLREHACAVGRGIRLYIRVSRRANLVHPALPEELNHEYPAIAQPGSELVARQHHTRPA